MRDLNETPYSREEEEIANGLAMAIGGRSGFQTVRPRQARAWRALTRIRQIATPE
jgi:hypothetical protein